MVERTALLASMTNDEKSVENLVTDANLQLACFLLPHQSIGESDPWVEVTSGEAPGVTGCVYICKPYDNPHALRAEADTDARGKGKEKVVKHLEVDSSDDEGICYSTLLDHLPIPQNLVRGINFLNLVCSVYRVEDSCSCSSDNLDVGCT